MKITKLDELFSLAKEKNLNRNAALVAAHEAHIMEAVVKAKKDGLIKPILIGNAPEIEKILVEYEGSTEGYHIIDSPSNDESVAIAIRMVKEKKVDLIIKGMIETADLMRQMLKKETGICIKGVVSAVGLLEIGKYHKLCAMTDMGINMFPNLEQKTAIIENAVYLMHRVGVENPKVAVLSAVEKVNPKMADTVDADAIKQKNLAGEISGCIIEGPISLDLAVSKEAAIVKKYESPVAGDADILMVPDIVSGNLLIKGIGLFGDMKTADIVLGCQVPIVFGSRGGPIESKYRSIALSALVAEANDH